MRESDCCRCRYGEVSSGARTVVFGNITVRQNGSWNITCRCPEIRSITIQDDLFLCSSFEEREDESGGEG